MSSIKSISTNKRPLTGAAAFVCGAHEMTSELEFALRSASPMVRYQWINGNEDQVQPGEVVA